MRETVDLPLPIGMFVFGNRGSVLVIQVQVILPARHAQQNLAHDRSATKIKINDATYSRNVNPPLSTEILALVIIPDSPVLNDSH